jgi:hypothetical protein
MDVTNELYNLALASISAKSKKYFFNYKTVTGILRN